MNSTPLLLVPLAAVALLSSQPSKAPVSESGNDSEIAAILDRPEFRAMVDQMQQPTDQLDLPRRSGRRAPAQKPEHEQGLHSGNLKTPEGRYSGARGLTPADEWQQMFPRYAVKLASAQ